MSSVPESSKLLAELTKLRTDLEAIEIPVQRTAVQRKWWKLALAFAALCLFCIAMGGGWKILASGEEVRTKNSKIEELNSKIEELVSDSEKRISAELETRKKIEVELEVKKIQIKDLAETQKKSDEERTKQAADLANQKNDIANKERQILEFEKREASREQFTLSQDLWLWKTLDEDKRAIDTGNVKRDEENRQLKLENEQLGQRLKNFEREYKRTIHFYWLPSDKQGLFEASAFFIRQIRQISKRYAELGATENLSLFEENDWRIIQEITENSMKYRAINNSADANWSDKIKLKVEELQKTAPSDIVLFVTTMDNDVNRNLSLPKSRNVLFLVLVDKNLQGDAYTSSWSRLAKNNPESQIYLLDKSEILAAPKTTGETRSLKEIFWLLFHNNVSP